MGSLNKSSLDKAQKEVVIGEELRIEDNEIVLNSNVTGTPTEDGGVRVKRGTETDARMLWDEVNDVWKVGLVGSEQQVGALGMAVNTNKLFVDASGNDTTGTGTEEKPFLTAQKAHDVAGANTVVYLGVGNFGDLAITKTIAIQGNDFSSIGKVSITGTNISAFLKNVPIRTTGISAQTSVTVNTGTFLILSDCSIENQADFAASRNVVCSGAGAVIGVLNCHNVNPILSVLRDIDILSGGIFRAANSLLNALNVDATSVFEHIGTQFNRTNSTITGTENRLLDISSIANSVTLSGAQTLSNKTLDSSNSYGDIIQNDVTPLHRMKETNDNSKTEKTKISASHKLRVVDEVLKAAGVGGAISLDGINDYVDFGDTPFDFSSDFSIEKWIKPHNVTSNDQFFVWKAAAFGIGMGTITGIAGTQNKRFCFVCYDGTQWNAVKDVSDAIVDTFYHVRGEIDTTANQIKLFVNGVNVANAAFTGNPATSNLKLFAGAYDSGGGVPAGFSDIDLDEIRIYNRILTSQENTDHYNGGSGQYGSPESGLIGLYHADDGSGQIVTDYSGNGNHGAMTGGSWTTGVVSVSAGIVTTDVYTSEDGTAANEEGKKTYGHCNGQTKIQGSTIPFCVSGTEKAKLDSTGYHVDTITEKTADAGVAVEGVTIKDSGIAAPKWKVTSIYDQQAGPLPLSTTFTSSGGTVILMVSGSAWRSTTGLIQVDVKVDTILKGSLKRMTNEATSHKSLIGNVIVTALAAGSHTILLEVAAGGTTADVNDFFDVVAYEVPF